MSERSCAPREHRNALAAFLAGAPRQAFDLERARREAPGRLNAALRLGVWIGPDWTEAQAMYERARELGMSKSRAEALAHVASRKDLWAFARYVAERIGCSVRTFQRAITQGKSLGLVRTARGKKTEVPPGANAPIACGWCHRWTVGRNLIKAYKRDGTTAAACGGDLI